MNKLSVFLLIGFILLSNISLKAQFNIWATNFGQSNNLINGIGVGDFQGNGATATNSRFHINNFYCNQPTGGLNGLLFRTDGNSSVENRWQLFTGANAGVVTEKFRLSVAASSSHVNLNVVQNANMLFSTNNTQRMTILGSNGWVGIGITTPTSVLHINKANAGEMFRTNGSWSLENRWRLFTTNTSTVEQFRLYVPDSTSDVFLQAQQATGNLSFNTAGGSSTNFPDTKLRIFPDDTDRMVAFENPNLTSNTTFVPAYNAKFIINDRNDLV